MVKAVKISVIIPVYNAEKYLPDCLESIINQTYKDFEVMLIDDGSTDCSGEICQQYAHEDSRIVALRQTNTGVSAAGNLGIKKAQGDYITFIDADDWVEPEYLENLVNCMTPGGFVAEQLVRDNAEAIKSQELHKLTSAEAQASVFSTAGMGGFAVARMFDRSTILEHSIRYCENIAICEDALFSVMYLSVAKGNIVLQERAEYHYRTSNGGAVLGRYGHKPPRPKDFTEIVALERAEQYLVDDESVRTAWQQRRDKAAVATLRTMVSCGYTNQAEINRLKKTIRKGCIRYLFGNVGSLSGKVSMLLSAISPELEWKVYKRQHTKK